MIYLINDTNRHLFSDLLDEMFRTRADVFKTRLDWDVVVTDGREIDRFDDLNPTYVVSVCDETGAFQGSVRLLPTTGPNMLNDVFSDLLDGGAPVAHPKIWESSRFSIRTNLPRHTDRATGSSLIHKVTVELLLGIIECAQRNKIEQIVSVYDARMLRVFRQIGCDADPVGTVLRIGSVMTHAGLFPTTDAFWDRLARTADITDPVVWDFWTPAHQSIPTQLMVGSVAI